MDALAIFNSCEAVFWITIGCVVWRNSRFHAAHQRLGRVTSVWFILFGISDVFEVFSGAWWRMWPLFVLKAACVIALISCGIVYRWATKRISEGVAHNDS
jgi:hypothetical protein